MILSICIPSYNRFDELKKNIYSILKAESTDFEIVIIDNCSPQSIFEEFDKIDKRVRVCKLDKPVDGKFNLNTCCRYGQGIFSLLCLDKDYIDGSKLDKFIEFLNSNRGVCGGFCVQNHQCDSGVEVCSSENRIIDFGYLGRHPSGYFYRTDIIRSALDSMTLEEIYNPFCPDILCAICAVKGSMAEYNNSLFFLETPEKSSVTKTYSYRNEKDLYFMPANRITQFEFYCSHAKLIVLNKNILNRLLFRLYKQTLYRVTYGFLEFMKNEDWCNHYNIQTRDVKPAEMNNAKKQLLGCAYKYCKNVLFKVFLWIYTNIFYYVKRIKK